MKTIKQFLLVFFFVATATSALSEEKIKVKADSIRIRFENCLLEVAAFDLKKNTLTNADIQNKVKELYTQLEKIEITEPVAGEKIYIYYSGVVNGVEQEFKNLILRSERNNKKSLHVSNGELLEADFGKFVMELEDENYSIRLHLKEIEDAKKIFTSEFAEKIQTADSEIPDGRKELNLWLVEDEGDSFKLNSLAQDPPRTIDMLELNAGAGAGLIQNQLVSSFNFRIGLTFSNKGIYRNSYFADYELLYDFSNSNESTAFSLNGFLSLGYERNFSLDPNKAKWYGFSVGYLLDRNNDFFEKNTFKLSIHKQINNSISLNPEVYFNDAFKNIYPGLRLKISF